MTGKKEEEASGSDNVYFLIWVLFLDREVFELYICICILFGRYNLMNTLKIKKSGAWSQIGWNQISAIYELCNLGPIIEFQSYLTSFFFL